ncbi:MAG: endonuclease [Spirochaetota bacterium]|nr:endonuclease [Spirochaetota bacterium]
MDNISIQRIYRILFQYYGKQGWWPGETEFEISIGAILTQSVSWRNVEIAISNLKQKYFLIPEVLNSKGVEEIASLIKSTGYFNQKAKKVKNFLEWFLKYDFSFDILKGMDTKTLREELLLINGIGPETADSILLYALSKKTFVIDAYTKRIFTRVGILSGKENYTQMQKIFHNRFKGGIQDYNEYHALIVKHGKDVCKKKPLCDGCCIAENCNGVME